MRLGESVERWLREMNLRYFFDPELRAFNGIVVDIKPRIIIYFSNGERFLHIMTLLLPIDKIIESQKSEIYLKLLRKNSEWSLGKFVILFNHLGIKMDIPSVNVNKKTFLKAFKTIALLYDDYDNLLGEKDEFIEVMYR